jgi:DNA polymerase, archaea type
LGEDCIWISDSYFKGCVELWSRERGLVRICVPYPPSFYMHLKDPHAYWEMIQALENRFRVEECSFNSIFGTFEGHRIYASRKVAEKIEIQIRHAAELYNVDVRHDQRYKRTLSLRLSCKKNLINSPIFEMRLGF